MRLAAIVLAAGHARRFGGDKLRAPFRGEPLVAHAIRAARAAPVERVVVVCRAPFGLGGEELTIASDALSDSLRAGLGAVADMDGAFVFLGDMPLIPPAIAPLLAARLGGRFAAVPTRDGQPGHPVLLAVRAFAPAAALTGDRGAGALLRTRDDVAWVACGEPGVLLDVDAVADLARLEHRRCLS